MDPHVLKGAFFDLNLIKLDPRSKYLRFITYVLSIPFWIVIIAAFLELFYHERFEVDFFALFIETQAVAGQVSYTYFCMKYFQVTYFYDVKKFVIFGSVYLKNY